MMRWLLISWVVLCCLVGPAHAAAPAGEEITKSISVNGFERRFKYIVSPFAAPQAGRPLVIHLHGDGGGMFLSEGWKNAVLNDANGAVLLSADGRNNIEESADIDDSAWRFRMDEAGRKYDDIDFINQLITLATIDDTLLGTKIDPNQVYLVGESRGAGFAYFLYADPRTRNKVRAIVPISGTFYCDGEAQNPGQSGTQPVPGSDKTCGYISPDGYWGPKPSLFSAPGVTRAPHILDIHGQLASDGGQEDEYTPPPVIVRNGTCPPFPAGECDYLSQTWSGWGDAAGCFTVRVDAATEQTLPELIGGSVVKTYAYSKSEDQPATRCNTLDLTFYIVQKGVHVPPGFEPTAWCFLSTVGGTPSTNACRNARPMDQFVFLPFTRR